MDHCFTPPWHLACLLLGLLWILHNVSALRPPLPSLVQLSQACNMPRERGKSKRGPLYYSAYTRRNRLPPTQLTLIIASRLRKNQPPIDPRGGPSMAEIPPPMNSAPPPLSHSPELDPPRAYSPDHFFGTGSCIVEEEIPPCWQETPLNVMAMVDEDDTW
jgi:hypothetical protein